MNIYCIVNDCGCKINMTRHYYCLQPTVCSVYINAISHSRHRLHLLISLRLVSCFLSDLIQSDGFLFIYCSQSHYHRQTGQVSDFSPISNELNCIALCLCLCVCVCAYHSTPSIYLSIYLSSM